MAEWQNPVTFAIWLAIFIVVFILLIGAIIIFTRLYIKRILEQQKKLIKAELEYNESLLKNSVDVQEKERSRIAAELHDGLVGKLNVVNMALATHSDRVDPVEKLQEAIQLTRSISHDLSPPLINELDIVSLLKDYVDSLNGDLGVAFYSQIATNMFDLENWQKLQLFRIVQEVLTNICKHANAEITVVNFRFGGDSIAVVVFDNGVGFEKEKVSGGLGMKNIELRANLLGADYKFKSSVGKGTSFILKLNTSKK